LTKNIRLSDSGRVNFVIRAEAFDVFNQANFHQPVSTVGSSTFGLITGTRFPGGDFGTSRQLQLSLKLTF
jgi:hypothetical protein